MCCFVFLSKETSYEAEVVQASSELAEQLTSAASEEVVSELLEHHDQRMKVLDARHDREKEKQIEGLKKRLADRRRKKMQALQQSQFTEVIIINPIYQVYIIII